MLARYAESGLTQREFCQRAGVGLSTLGRWLRLAAKSEHEDVAEKGVVFMEAAVEYRPAQSGEVASGFDPGELAILLRIVEDR